MQAFKKFIIYFKPYIYILAFIVWASVLFKNITQNPSLDESQRKLSMMKADMAILAEKGIKVLYSPGVAKYGGATFFGYFYDEGRHSEFLKKYEEILLLRNWKKPAGSTNIFCKDGVLAEIEEDSGVKNGHLYSSVYMTFDSSTKRKSC